MSFQRISVCLVLLLVSCGNSPSSKSNSSSNTPNSSSNNPNSSSNNPNSSSNSSTAPGDIATQLWNTICDAAFNCDTVNPELLLVAGRFTSEAECRAVGALPGLDLNTEQLEADVAAGRIRYDEQKADECFDAVQEELCLGGGFEDVPACDDVVEGLVGQGQPCGGGECADGLSCRSELDEECSGTCEPNCGEQQCTGDQYCDFAEQSCKETGGVGDACDWDGHCGDALFCDDGQCATRGTVSEGGACNDRQACADGLLCLDDRCTRFAVANVGEPCDLTAGSEQSTLCAAGSVCTDLEVDGESLIGTCGAPKLQGADCRITFECAWGFYCTAENPLEIGSCEPTLADGSACNEDSDCRSYDCRDDVCFGGDADDVICMF